MGKRLSQSIWGYEKKLVLLLALFFATFFSCKKEKITKNHPELVGTWKEINGLTKYAKLEIKSNGSGILYDCYPGDCGDIQFRKWRIKNNHLYYGVSNDLGEITKFPQITSTDILIGTNDTIKGGEHYMILNHNYYVALAH